jgi:exosortase H (IPTLxxWG-CTERM-specific)
MSGRPEGRDNAPASARKARSRRLLLRFLIPLVVLVALAGAGVRTTWFDTKVLSPYTSMIASWSAAILRSVGVDAQARGPAIHNPSFAVSIRKGCDGLEATLLLVCASLAYPFVSWRKRVGAILSGFLLIFVLNLARVVGLFLLGLKASREAFTFFHLYVAQFTIVIAVVLLWLFWISRDLAPTAHPSAPGDVEAG